MGIRDVIIPNSHLFFTKDDIGMAIKFYGEEAIYNSLDQKDIIKLIKKYRKTGDLTLRDRLFNSFFKYMFKTSQQQYTKGSVDDLTMVCYQGFEKALEKYECDRNVPFIAYLKPWIDHYIRKCKTNDYSLIRIPPYLFSRIGAIRKMRAKNYSTLKISLKLDCSVDAVLKMEKNYEMFRIGSMVNSENEVMDIADSSVSQTETIINNDLYSYVIKMIDTLNDKDRDIIERRFGLNGHKRETLESIAQSYGVTRERVRQMEYHILYGLKKKASKNNKRGDNGEKCSRVD